MTNWSEYRRMLNNIDKGITNENVSELLTLNYSLIRLKIGKVDEDVFNDTFIKMTYNYLDNEDFVERFIYYYNLLKGAYLRDSKSKIFVEITEFNLPYEEPDYFKNEEIKPKVDFKKELLKKLCQL